MPSPAAGHPKSYIFSPLRIGQVPTMFAFLFLYCASGNACERCCDSNKKGQSASDGKKGQQTESVWESWAKPLETEWIISVRASPPVWYVPPPVMGSQPAPATGYPLAPATGCAPTPVSGSALANVTAFAARPVASLW
ncbi:hypothetical protein AMAG_19807 [Allomyces macrogynus ATCC 38327]|uniref:Uncharacterized protein n=1 Tax=Allomyces macrogynus (strain ATCC 38327) TaxID=578462 RepID=A0A0L0T121_ALLM3|nr:hypothetical protein AMAG_19807 [Allomyces macrogynus ATCC 38327]|eukprot:KNE68452.1 hypothetical protein AMAG_19807 [Allomyces macrogynus ATCC 38327]